MSFFCLFVLVSKKKKKKKRQTMAASLQPFRIWLEKTFVDNRNPWDLAETPAVTRVIEKRQLYRAYLKWCHRIQLGPDEIVSFKRFCDGCEIMLPHLQLYQLHTVEDSFRFGTLARVRSELHAKNSLRHWPDE